MQAHRYRASGEQRVKRPALDARRGLVRRRSRASSTRVEEQPVALNYTFSQAQLQRQFYKYAKEAAGRGAGPRTPSQRECYARALAALVGDGSVIVVAAFASAASDKRFNLSSGHVGCCQGAGREM